MRFIGPEDGCPEENLQHNQATQIFGTYRVVISMKNDWKQIFKWGQ